MASKDRSTGCDEEARIRNFNEYKADREKWLKLFGPEALIYYDVDTASDVYTFLVTTSHK